MEDWNNNDKKNHPISNKGIDRKAHEQGLSCHEYLVNK